MQMEEVSLGSRELIPIGEGRSFAVGATQIAVFRGRDGDLYAVQNRCPHRNGPLADGILGAGHVVCPYHAYRFDLATGACLTDPECRLRTFPVREERGVILVSVSE
jgi:nitrite reductase (NADH) small subunit